MIVQGFDFSIGETEAQVLEQWYTWPGWLKRKHNIGGRVEGCVFSRDDTEETKLTSFLKNNSILPSN